MSQGNACAMLGLANTNKIPPIGEYVQDPQMGPLPDTGPCANGPYIGCNGNTYYVSDVLGEAAAAVATNGYVMDSNSGSATGKNARWVTNSGGTLTIPADGRVAVSAAGVATAAAGSGAYKIHCGGTGIVIPQNSWFWAFVI